MNRIRSIASNFGTLLLSVHLVGVGISATYFYYTFPKQHGFVAWTFFGGVVPFLKSLVWEVFLISAVLTSNQAKSPESQQTQDPWWQGEYLTLVNVVQSLESRRLTTTYKAGLHGEDRVVIALEVSPDGGFALTMEGPAGALMEVDPETGDVFPARGRSITIIRDYDIDGVPDDFFIQVNERADASETNFVPFRGGPEHMAISMQWTVGIGYAINHFLHGVDSSMPRQ